MQNPPPGSQRTYKACTPCRSKKARCDLDLNGRPPCTRCRRQHKDCVFDDAQNRAKRPRTNGSRVDHSSLPRVPRQAELGRPNAGQAQDHSANEAPPTTSDRIPQGSPSSSGAVTSVMRTVVSTGNDALNILFEAASHDRSPTFNRPEAFANNRTPRQIEPPEKSPNNTQPDIPRPGSEVLGVWESCRFVTMGWLSAKDAVMYLDLFFRNMSPLSPILTDFYASHEHHNELITFEPMLCCTILLISSRYHVLPGLAGLSKGYFLHNRLWKHWQSLMMRVTFGQEKSSETSERTVGTIESLLLMSEWHPRSIHFPPEGDGWDSDLVVRPPHHTNGLEEASPSSQWLEEVVEPVRRSDQMSWMLLGSALSLAHKLGIFGSQNRWSEGSLGDESPRTTNCLLRRVLRVQKLLYVYMNQLASRLGCTSLIPQTLTFAVAEGSETLLTNAECQWDTFMGAWIGLTKLVKSISDVFFPSTASTRDHLLSGRYVGLLDHFGPLLAQWREKHLDPHQLKDTLDEILCIEYQYVKVFMNSLGIQAVVERALQDTNLGIALEYGQPINVGDVDHEFVQEVISGCCQILEKVTNLAESGVLRFSPFRFYIRVTSASVFLLKALSLGVRNTQLQTSLDILDRSIQALKNCSLDDMHLAPRFASLLEVHLAQLRRHFIVSSKRPHLSRGVTRPASAEQSSVPQAAHTEPAAAQELGGPTLSEDFPLQELSEHDWLSLPFDPSMAPFGMDGSQVFPGFEEGALDFVWNLSN